MNRQKLSHIIPRWQDAYERFHSAPSDRAAVFVRHEINRLRPLLQEAWCDTAKVESLHTAKAESPQHDSFRNFDFYLIPASPAMLALIEAAWECWCQWETRISRRIIPTDRHLLAVTLANIVNAELTDPTT